MDGSTFDRLTRFFGARRSRRTLAGTLLGAGAGLLGLADAEAAPCPKRKKRCKKRCIPRRHCCTNANCRPKTAGKVCRRGRCVCRPTAKRCGPRCIPKAACCGGCPAGLVCKQATCCVGTSAALTAALGPGGPATIQLCPASNYQGTFAINRSLTLRGAGASSTILDGGGTGRVLGVRAGVTANLQDLQITNGRLALASDFGAGVFNEGNLTLSGCLVTDNQTPDSSGGGIMNLGTTATPATIRLISSSVTNNVAAAGGGIINSDGTLLLRGTSRVEGNTAAQVGGGIYTLGAASRVFLQDATVITGNRVESANQDSGGGIFKSTMAGPVTFFDTARVFGNQPNDCTNVICPS